ncbi:c-5 sterol desaturase [Thoreauomyces humboldtii]|nr:c-5 sterol desaturase [Thoreauomyces humboldtii]
MDIILKVADQYGGLDRFYAHFPSILEPYVSSRDHAFRQCLSLWLIALVGVNILYFLFSTISYYTLFDQRILKHPKYLPNQIRREIALSVTSFPITAAVTVPWFFAEVRGYSKLYYHVDDFGWPYALASVLGFLAFTDCGIYWIHRAEHHPMLYGWLHKQHHAWKVSTPYASFAFHPLDGYFQSIPYHLFVFLFPMHVYAYLAAFVVVQIWTISIHDGAYFTQHPAINSSAHHTVHHLEFNYNYGQYTTFWDRIGGSYKRPDAQFENDMFFDRPAVHDKVDDLKHALSSTGGKTTGTAKATVPLGGAVPVGGGGGGDGPRKRKPAAAKAD